MKQHLKTTISRFIKQSLKFYMKTYICIIFSLILLNSNLYPQQSGVLIDEVVAVVGNRIILESDLESQVLQYQAEGATTGKQTLKCQVLEDLMIQKLFVNKAEVDSIIITDSQVDAALDQRIRYFVSQFGSQERMEKFYGKTISQIKEEFREVNKKAFAAGRAAVHA